LTDWEDIRPKKGYGEWHIQWISAVEIWQTHSYRVEFCEAIAELLESMRAWPRCQWRLHHYELNETIPGELLCL